MLQVGSDLQHVLWPQNQALFVIANWSKQASGAPNHLRKGSVKAFKIPHQR